MLRVDFFGPHGKNGLPQDVRDMSDQNEMTRNDQTSQNWNETIEKYVKYHRWQIARHLISSVV